MGESLVTHLRATEVSEYRRLSDSSRREVLRLGIEAVDKRGLRVALDVYPEEPRGSRTFASPDVFRTYASGGLVYGTPHIAAATDQAQSLVAFLDRQSSAE